MIAAVASSLTTPTAALIAAASILPTASASSTDPHRPESYREAFDWHRSLVALRLCPEHYDPPPKVICLTIQDFKCLGLWQSLLVQ